MSFSSVGFSKGLARGVYIDTQLAKFMSVVIQKILWVNFVWVPSAVILEAETISRSFIPSQEWSLHPTYWQAFTSTYKAHNLPTPTVDAFASSSKKKCEHYLSQHMDRVSLGNFFSTP